MRLLLDANVSRRLIPRISKTLPRFISCGLARTWECNRRRDLELCIDPGFIIVSKDEDFHQRSLVSGPPPKVIWGLGNCTTNDIEQAIHDGHDTIIAFLEDETASFLALD